MLIAGIDEAGRGPALGPMVLAIATIKKSDEERLFEIGVKDSKLLSPEKRTEQFSQIKKALYEYSTVHVTAKEIDKLRLRKSLNEIEAMKIGYLLNKLKQKPDVVYVDAPDPIASKFADRIWNYITFETRIKSEHKADVKYPVVSAASILAKVERDLEIENLSHKYGKMGSGYPHDPTTIEFIKKWINEKKSLPDFARKSWQTNINLMDSKFQKKLF